MTHDEAERRLDDLKHKAVVAAHPQIRSFLSSRKWDDEGFARAIIIEYIKHSTQLKTIKEDDEL